MTTNAVYRSTDPAYDLYEDDGTTVIPAVQVMMSHTGTLDTTGHNGGGEDADRTLTFYGEEVVVGPDNSAAAINEYLKPDLDPLPDGYVAGPTLDGPIY
jgi:hypothetical protein